MEAIGQWVLTAQVSRLQNKTKQQRAHRRPTGRPACKVVERLVESISPPLLNQPPKYWSTKGIRHGCWYPQITVLVCLGRNRLSTTVAGPVDPPQSDTMFKLKPPSPTGILQERQAPPYFRVLLVTTLMSTRPFRLRNWVFSIAVRMAFRAN